MPRSPRRGALLVACTLVAACSQEAVPAPQEAAGSLASSVESADLKDPFAAHEGRARPADAAPTGALKDPFERRADAPAGAPASDLKNPFERRADASPSPAAAAAPSDAPTASSGLKDPFRGERAADASGGIKDPFRGEKAAPGDDGLKNPFKRKSDPP